jgi:hypothetical protein
MEDLHDAFLVDIGHGLNRQQVAIRNQRNYHYFMYMSAEN